MQTAGLRGLPDYVDYRTTRTTVMLRVPDYMDYWTYWTIELPGLPTYRLMQSTGLCGHDYQSRIMQSAGLRRLPGVRGLPDYLDYRPMWTTG